MDKRFIHMKIHLFLSLAVVIAGLFPAPETRAWGRTAHAIIGQAALATLEPAKRARAMEILGVTSAAALPAALEEACFWPDTVRENPRWAWSAPQHYVNIPRPATHYNRQRDCHDGRCAPEAILKYAARLSQAGPSQANRWQDFAWLCHLVGDLHQPLHAGYRDDRGGNLVEIEFRGQNYNLHEFWDRALVDDRLAGQAMPDFCLDPWMEPLVAAPWAPAEVAAWTAESHGLVATHAYPPGPVIGDEFADPSWTVIRQQWGKAATRLGRILEIVLAEEISGDSD
jgi:hypothetical protein